MDKVSNKRIVLLMVVLIAGSLLVRIPVAAGVYSNGKIVFSTSENRIEIMNCDGTGRYEVPLPYGPQPGVGFAVPQWSPDGCWITFLSGGKNEPINSQIYVAHPNGSGFRQVSDGTYGLAFPDFSPDGCKIVYHQVYGSIYTIDKKSCDWDSSPPMEHQAIGNHTRWSPDGLYASYSNWGNIPLPYESDVFLYDFVTNDSKQITQHGLGQAFNYAAWSPDGKYLAVNEITYGTTIDCDIWIFKRDCCEWKPLKNLTDAWGNSDENFPAWSPDGKSIVFASNKSGNWDLWFTPVDSFNPINLTNTPGVNENYPDVIPEPATLLLLGLGGLALLRRKRGYGA